jgi:hypothetical protein
MFVCRIFNEFSVNPSWVMEFETANELDIFNDRVSQMPHFKKLVFWTEDSKIHDVQS